METKNLMYARMKNVLTHSWDRAMLDLVQESAPEHVPHLYYIFTYGGPLYLKLMLSKLNERFQNAAIAAYKKSQETQK